MISGRAPITDSTRGRAGLAASRGMPGKLSWFASARCGWMSSLVISRAPLRRCATGQVGELHWRPRATHRGFDQLHRCHDLESQRQVRAWFLARADRGGEIFKLQAQRLLRLHAGDDYVARGVDELVPA